MHNNNTLSFWPVNQSRIPSALWYLCKNEKVSSLVTSLPRFLEEFCGHGEISHQSHIDPTAIIQGNVIIEDGAKVMEFAKIVGPTYIGKGAVIGNHTLIRQSYIGTSTVVGYNTDIARSYIGDQCWTLRTHISDSYIDNNVHFGAGSVLASLRFDSESVVVHGKSHSESSDARKFGSIIGEYTKLGASVCVMPGILIGSHVIIGSGATISKSVSDSVYVSVAQRLQERPNQVLMEDIDYTDFRKPLYEDL